MSVCVAQPLPARLACPKRGAHAAHQSMPKPVGSAALQPRCPPASTAWRRSAAAPRLCVQALSAAVDMELAAQLEKLMEEHLQLDEEELATRVAAIEKRSLELGCNKITAELNDGLFTAQPLAGRLKRVTGPSAVLTLGGLTFGAVQPGDLQLAFRPLTSEPPIFKGKRDGVPNSYIVTSAFSVPSHDLAGISKAVGTYTLDEENPQRLTVTFSEVNLLPDLGGSEGALESWVALLGGANSGAVDASSGQVHVQLASPASAQLDYLVMAPGWQMTRSNFGSIVLLKAA